MTDDVAKGMGIMGIVLLVIFLALVLVYVGLDYAAMHECKALGFEYGTYTLAPEMGVQCEYRLRVPLREVLPPIGNGGNDDTPYIPGNLAL